MKQFPGMTSCSMLSSSLMAEIVRDDREDVEEAVCEVSFAPDGPFGRSASPKLLLKVVVHEALERWRNESVAFEGCC